MNCVQRNLNLIRSSSQITSFTPSSLRLYHWNHGECLDPGAPMRSFCFFDNVSHALPEELLRQHVSDPKMLRLAVHGLKARVMIDGQLEATEKETGGNQ
jgi:hypothetical protein